VNEKAPSTRTELKRHPERGTEDPAAIASILDEALIAHVAFVDEGAPTVVPMSFVRMGSRLFLHGSQRSRLSELARKDGLEVCVAVSLLDGLVLAASAMFHSMNYRSVVLYGRARHVTEPSEKQAALSALVDRFADGRSQIVRAPSEAELAATSVLVVPIDQASAKQRSGPPADPPSDRGRPAYSGVIPLALARGEAMASPYCREPAPAPAPALKLARLKTT
jgi:hypothetical protein